MDCLRAVSRPFRLTFRARTSGNIIFRCTQSVLRSALFYRNRLRPARPFDRMSPLAPFVVLRRADLMFFFSRLCERKFKK